MNPLPHCVAELHRHGSPVAHSACPSEQWPRFTICPLNVETRKNSVHMPGSHVTHEHPPAPQTATAESRHSIEQVVAVHDFAPAQALPAAPSAAHAMNTTTVNLVIFAPLVSEAHMLPQDERSCNRGSVLIERDPERRGLDSEVPRCPARSRRVERDPHWALGPAAHGSQGDAARAPVRAADELADEEWGR